MKKLILLLGLLTGCVGSVAAEMDFRELFKQTEGKVIDFAILSSVEAGYARDLINGGNYVVGQFPMIYITPYISGDFGYLTGYDDSTRGALMFGGSLRLNKLFEDAFAGKVDMIKGYVPSVESNWEKIWIGPFISKRFSDFDSTLIGGIKAGLRW
mgnify:CR=1 FL=1